MKYLVAFLFIAFLVTSGKTYSQVVISGNAVTYSGTELVFKKYSDPFTNNEVEVGKCLVSTNGDFSVTLPVNETTYLFSHLGVYLGYIYVEPGKNYIISFPEKTEKSPAEKLNPFFKETEFMFAIKEISDKDLNFLIQSFNNFFNPYFIKFANNIKAKNKKELIDTTVVALRKINANSANSFYENYVYYKIGVLKHLAYQQKTKSLSLEYFQSKPILYNNPAYIELFNQVYNKYFYFFGRTTYGKKIFEDVNGAKSYYRLNNTLKRDSILINDSLRELVVLKNVHDEFYSNNFSRSGLLNVLDSLIAITKIEKHKEIGEYIKAKITRLMIGFAPPEFELYDKDGKLHKLSDFKGKYVYLNFCVCNSYGCIKEYDLLKKINAKYRENEPTANKFQIITIISADDLKTMKSFLDNSDYDWLFLHYGNQPKILELYDIRAYPTYFLIDPNGKLLFSPAASPGENFEMLLFQIMKKRGDL
jgi:peroxiredoxin